MNYIIYPKEQKNVIYPWQINHTVLVKVQHNIFILNQKGKLYPQKKMYIPYSCDHDYVSPATSNNSPELTALKGNRPGTKVSHLLRGG